MQTLRLLITGLLLSGLSSIYAQDVITLKTGDEIKGKVTEITNSEVKYKRFENLDGPTIIIEKQKIFAINYENGTREVLNALTVEYPTTEKAEVITTQTKQENENRPFNGPHGKNFYTGIYLNPIGALTWGPTIGAEFTFYRRIILDGYYRFFPAGLLSINDYGEIDTNGMGVGISLKYFHGRRNGGPYVGALFEYLKYTYYGDGYNDCKDMVLAANMGYKFQFSSGFYMRAGVSLGLLHEFSYVEDGKKVEDFSYNETYYTAEFCVGFSF
jgi:hypothetical protein